MHIIIQNTNLVRGNSVVKNETEQDVYFVKGKLKVFSPTRKKFINDLAGNTVFTIRNKWFRFLFNSAIIKDAQGNKMKLKSKMSFKTYYVLTGAGYNYSIGKNPDGYGLAIFKEEQVIATFNKHGSGFVNDRFNVDYFNESDLPMVVAIIIAFDNIRDKDKKDLYSN